MIQLMKNIKRMQQKTTVISGLIVYDALYFKIHFGVFEKGSANESLNMTTSSQTQKAQVAISQFHQRFLRAFFVRMSFRQLFCVHTYIHTYIHTYMHT